MRIIQAIACCGLLVLPQAQAGRVTFVNQTDKNFHVYLKIPGAFQWAARTPLLRPDGNPRKHSFNLSKPTDYVVHLEYEDGSGVDFKSRRLGVDAETNFVFSDSVEAQSVEVPLPIEVMRNGKIVIEYQVPTKVIEVPVILMTPDNDEEAESARAAERKSPQTDRPKLGISIHKCDQGIHIDSVTPGSSATRCIDVSGTTVALSSGDHIISINTVTPQSVEAFTREIATSAGRSINLLVKQRGTNKLRRMTASLARGPNGQHRMQRAAARKQPFAPPPPPAAPGSRRLLGISVHKCDTGIHIDEVKPSGAATRLQDENGTTFALEPGDHVLTINGFAPPSAEQFSRVVQNSTGRLQLLIQDKNGSTIRRLFADF